MGKTAAPYVVIFALVWLVAMAWRIYPQFGDAIRVDGRTTTVGDYIDQTCGERVGPAATTCLGEARGEARRLLRTEQAKSLLLIVAPLLAGLAILLPLTALRRKIALLAAILLLAGPPAFADSRQTAADAGWRAMDNCSRQAIAQFPDYTPASLAKREEARRKCLRSQSLPAPQSTPAAGR